MLRPGGRMPSMAKANRTSMIERFRCKTPLEDKQIEADADGLKNNNNKSAELITYV